MSFTTIDAVAAHYPGFQRGVANQNPADAQIQAWIESQSARITALSTGRGYTLDGLATNNPQAYSLLSLMNEVGAAADLGEALFSLLGPEASPQGWANPNNLRRSYENMLGELGRGTYDKLFIAGARTGDAYPALGGVAGQETDLDDEDSNAAFKKDDVF
ncbi:MAG: hypothetical protein HYS33_05960 [Acidobacteria bacterium]|nr:hypothetical protein [Acidobacteriota bacterium]